MIHGTVLTSYNASLSLDAVSVKPGKSNGAIWTSITGSWWSVDPMGATKNSEVRRVPMVGQAPSLFARMRAERSGEPKDAKVFRVRECQKAMNRAANLVGMERITHHDLRHYSPRNVASSHERANTARHYSSPRIRA